MEQYRKDWTRFNRLFREGSILQLKDVKVFKNKRIRDIPPYTPDLRKKNTIQEEDKEQEETWKYGNIETQNQVTDISVKMLLK